MYLVKLCLCTTVIFSSNALRTIRRPDGHDWDLRVRRDLSSRTEYEPLIVTTILVRPYTMFLGFDSSVLGNDRYTGYIPELLTILSTRYNFTYKIIPVKDGKYGSPQQNGSWDGMIGEVIRGKVHLAAAPLTITALRERVVDFVKPFGSFGFTILIKKPDVTEFEYTFNILEPFSKEAWIALAAAWVLAWLFMCAMNCFNPYEHDQMQKRQMVDDGSSNVIFGVADSFWYLWTLTNWQGFDRSPRSVACKILSCFWMCFVTFVLVTYTGAAVNDLFWASTVHGRDTQQLLIKNFRDLAMKKHGYAYGIYAHGSTHHYFTNNPKLEEFKVMKNYWDAIESDVLVQSNYEGVQKSRNEKYAYIMEELTARYVSNTKPCDLMTVGRVGSLSYGFAMAPGSPYLEDFHTAFLEMTETGDIEALEQKWFKDKGECWKDDDEDGDSALHLNKPLRVNHKNFWSVLIFLACGLFISALVAVAEILYFKYKGQYKDFPKRQTSQQPFADDADPVIQSS